MAIISSTLYEETDSTISIKLTAPGEKEYIITVVKHPKFTVEELIQRWTRKANREYMSNRIMFERMFIARTNARHEFLVQNPDQIR